MIEQTPMAKEEAVVDRISEAVKAVQENSTKKLPWDSFPQKVKVVGHSVGMIAGEDRNLVRPADNVAA